MSITTNNQQVRYWDLVYELTMQGNLFYVCELLKIHSELSGYLNTPTTIIDIDQHNRNNTSSRNNTNNNTDRQSLCTNQFIHLLDVLSSHPYARFIFNQPLPQHDNNDNYIIITTTNQHCYSLQYFNPRYYRILLLISRHGHQE